MGLAHLEVIMALEQEFDIEFKDRDLESVETVGQLYQLTLKELGSPKLTGCYSSHVFYRFRRSLMKILGIKRNQVFPRQKVEEYLFAEDYLRFKRSLSEEMEIKLPELISPDWIDKLSCFIIGTGCFLTIFLPMFLTWFVPCYSAIFIMFAIWLVLILLNKALLFLASPLAKNYSGTTTREFVKQIVVLNYDTLRKKMKFTTKELLLRFKKVFVEQLGIEAPQVHMDDNFYHLCND